ncbi:uncharacterized protein LOC108099517 [Drosophila ficusphila]|uniref:uncharacterized protein LOC108099517 n=1 Tax=Drosophila ficusphila TaxID=30025 RepID=UPI0007E89B9A|nr:uncharacterized protein LOC108099517 [Drosophila ficusphila]
MSKEANITPQSGRKPRLGLGKRGCQSTPLMRLKNEESAERTPKNRNLETPKTLALSLSGRRIGLSKNRTDSLSKKKLEFAVAQEFKEEEQKNVTNTSKNEPKKPDKKNTDNQNCKKAEDGNNSEQENHPQANQPEECPKNRQIIELEGDIEVWRRAFIASVHDILTMVEPGLSKRDLLAQLGIPLAMLRYLEED